MRLFFVTSMLLVTWSVTAQETMRELGELGLPYMTRYTPQDYKGYFDNWDMVQDDRGILYVGNGAGMLEYDGVNWRMLETPGVAAVKSLAKDSHGRIYYGSVGDMGYLEPGPSHNMTFHSLANELDSAYRSFGNVWFTYAVHDSIYFITDNLVFRWARGRFKVWDKLEVGYASVAHETVYAGLRQKGKQGGLARFSGDSIVMMTPLEKMGSITAILPQGTENLLAIDNQGVMYTCHRSGGILVPAHKKVGGLVYSTARLPNGDYALGTLSSGVYIVDPYGTIKANLKKEDGLSSNMIINVFADAEGDLWLSTDNGITRVELNSPIRLLKSDIMDDVNGLAWFDNSVYVASNSGLVRLRSDGQGKPQFTKVKGIDQVSFSCDKVGDDLLVANMDGVYVVNPENRVERILEVSTRALAYPREINDRVFYGLLDGRIGAFVKKNGHWKVEDGTITIPGNPFTMLQATNGNIFIGTAHDGLFEIAWAEQKKTHAPSDRHSLVHYDTACGLPNLDAWDICRVQKSIFICFPENGMYRHDSTNQVFVLDSAVQNAIPYADALPNSIYPAASENAFWLPVSHELKTRLFKYEKGALTEHPIVGRFSEASITGMLDGGDVALIGTTQGIIAYDYRKPFDGSNLFSVAIRKVMVNRDSSIYEGHFATGSSQGIELPYATNNLRFQFALPSYDQSSENQYQYFLEGFDRGWSAWSAESQVDVTNLSEGDYIFHVRGKNIYGHVSEEDRFTFAVRPPWYRSALAYTAYGLLLIGVIVAVVNWRSAKLRQEKAVLENLIAERTEQISLQTEKLSQQTEKLKEMDHIKSNFFANISHEFRTPLTLIKGPVEQWLRRSGDALTREEGEMIYRNSDRLLQLVNQLLDLSKIDAENLRVENKTGDLEVFLGATTSSFTSLASHGGFEYIIQITATQRFAMFDHDKLEKIVYNLLSNAFKFTPNGGKVTFRAVFENSQLRMEVSDNGNGIHSEDLPYIFDRFYQAGERVGRNGEGTGVGLALVKEIVSLLQGEISVDSAPGMGSLFTVILPITEVSSWDADAPVTPTLRPVMDTASAVEESDPPGEELETILIVEDNSDMRTFIQGQLAGQFNVMMAANGEEGLIVARHDVPDLIITDLMMPVMDGMAFCREIRVDERTSHIPLIMLTARGDRDSKLSGLETGADDYLTKPFDANELTVRIKNLLAQRKQLRRKFSQQVLLQPKDILITSRDSRFLERIENVIEENLAREDFGAAQMQDAMAMSKTQLQRKMKALTDQSPGEYLRAYRLKRAAQLLEKQSGNITEVAFATGFASQSYFTKAFKAYYGMSPSEYVKQVKAGQ